MLNQPLSDIVPQWFQKIFPPPTPNDADEEKSEIARQFYLLFVWVLLACLILVPTFILFGRWPDAGLVFVFLVVSVCLLWYLPNLEVSRMANFLAWGAYIGIYGGVAMSDLGIYNPSLAIIYPVLIFCAFFAPQTLIPFGVASYIGYILLYLSSFVRDYQVDHEQAIIDLVMAFLGLTLAITYLSYSIRRIVDRAAKMRTQQELLTEQQTELVEYRDHLKDLVVQRTADLERARTEAVSADRAKSLFLAKMSHELRTPLNAIINYSELIKENVAGQDEVLGDADRIRDSGKQLLQAIDQILQMTQIEADAHNLNPARFPIVTLLHKVEQKARVMAEEKGLEFTVRTDIDVGELLYSDWEKLKEVLDNLLDNAIKFTETGSVSLTARLVPSLDVNERYSYVWFSVVDTGIGVSREIMDHIYQPFWQAEADYDRRYEGTGLGLTVSKLFCEVLDGRISCDGSLWEQGSTFNVYIPQLLPDSTAVESDPL